MRSFFNPNGSSTYQYLIFNDSFGVPSKNHLQDKFSFVHMFTSRGSNGIVCRHRCKAELKRFKEQQQPEESKAQLRDGWLRIGSSNS